MGKIWSPDCKFWLQNKNCAAIVIVLWLLNWVVIILTYWIKRKSPYGNQFRKFSCQYSIFGHTGDQWVTISSPVMTTKHPFFPFSVLICLEWASVTKGIRYTTCALTLVFAGGRPSSYFRFFLIAFFLPPVLRLLCQESREIPVI